MISFVRRIFVAVVEGGTLFLFGAKTNDLYRWFDIYVRTKFVVLKENWPSLAIEHIATGLIVTDSTTKLTQLLGSHVNVTLDDKPWACEE